MDLALPELIIGWIHLCEFAYVLNTSYCELISLSMRRHSSERAQIHKRIGNLDTSNLALPGKICCFLIYMWQYVRKTNKP